MAFSLYLITAALVVDRSDRNLFAVPTNIHSGVTTLILSRNHIQRINDRSVASLLALGKFNLDDNGINFISRNAFVNNIHLSALHLNRHRLLSIPPGLGGSWRSLVTFVLAHGQVNMPVFNLTNFPALRRLDMNFGLANSLMLHKIPSLRYLHAIKCNLRAFPDLSSSPKLKLVQLNDNKFSRIPQSALSGLTRLKTLAFTNCRVTHLPDLSHLTSLRSLFVSGNAFKAMPDIYHLPLTQIRLKNNPLRCDKTLCWIRMWDYVKPSLQPTDASQKGVCAKPKHMKGRLMNVHPPELKCYEGRPRWTTVKPLA